MVKAQSRVYPADAVVNVTLAPYLAIPNDGLDDTAALQQAINDQVDTGRILYFPTGVYNVSNTLEGKNSSGLWRPHLTLQGQERGAVILQLPDNAPGYDNPVVPKAVIATGSFQEPGDNPDGGGNKAFRNSICDLTINTGAGNPGAVGIDYAVSNIGVIRNVTVRTEDGNGSAGIAIRRSIPGPGLIKNVSVTGFDTAVDMNDILYGITIEDLTIQGQKVAGVRVSDNILHVRHLRSTNQVPAVLVTGGMGVLTLLDSNLTGGSASQPAIDCRGTLRLRNVTTAGYRPAALKWHGSDIQGPDFSEWAGPAPLGTLPVSPSAELLPIEETPDYWNPDLGAWRAVGLRQAGEADDTVAIQRAIDSGAHVVYFPKNRTYFLSDTVVVRGAVRQILGMGSEISLGAAQIPFGDPNNPRPLFRIDGTEGQAVFVEQVFFNAQYPGEIIFENNSPKDVVIKNCGGWIGADGHRRSYRNTPLATGKLFLEDVYLHGWEFTNQRVWARQLNPENWDGDGSEPQVLNRGGKLWILGFKTEGPAPFLSTTGGGVTELLGAYNYVSATKVEKVPANSVPYPISDSRANLTFVTDNFRNDSEYLNYISETQGRYLRNLAPADLPPRNGNPSERSYAVPLYRSRTDYRGEPTVRLDPGKVVMTYRLAVPRAVTPVPAWSENLVNWHEGDVPKVMLNATEDTEFWEAAMPISGDRLFLRLQSPAAVGD